MNHIKKSIGKFIGLLVVFSLLFVLTGCEDLLDESTSSEPENQIVSEETEYVEGIVTDRKFHTGYKGNQYFSVIIKYQELVIKVENDAELYNDYQVGESVPILLHKYTHENDETSRKIEYNREYERHTILQALENEGKN